jgi:hypothetical protein
MIASRLDDRERVTPALTDHAEDKGGVIGAQTQYPSADSVNHCGAIFTAILRASSLVNCRSSARLVLEIDVAQCLTTVVAHDEAGVFHGQTREAGSGGPCLVIASDKPKYRDHHQNKNVKRKSAWA